MGNLCKVLVIFAAMSPARCGFQASPRSPSVPVDPGSTPETPPSAPVAADNPGRPPATPTFSVFPDEPTLSNIAWKLPVSMLPPLLERAFGATVAAGAGRDLPAHDALQVEVRGLEGCRSSYLVADTCRLGFSFVVIATLKSAGADVITGTRRIGFASIDDTEMQTRLQEGFARLLESMSGGSSEAPVWPPMTTSTAFPVNFAETGGYRPYSLMTFGGQQLFATSFMEAMTSILRARLAEMAPPPGVRADRLAKISSTSPKCQWTGGMTGHYDCDAPLSMIVSLSAIDALDVTATASTPLILETGDMDDVNRRVDEAIRELIPKVVGGGSVSGDVKFTP